MNQYKTKLFLVEAVILALLSAQVKASMSYYDDEEEFMTEGPEHAPIIKEEYITKGPNPASTTEEDYSTKSPDPAPIIKEEYITKGPNPASTTEEDYSTKSPDPAPIIEEEYITKGPEPAPTTEEDYSTKSPNPSRTTKKEYVTKGRDPLPKTSKNTTDPILRADNERTHLIQGAKDREILIYLIIIGILIILCTVLLVSTIALAYQVSILKGRLKARWTRNNSNFAKGAGLWSNGPSQLPGEPVETNVSLEEVKPLHEKEEAVALKDEGAAKPLI
ncbi:uncharacterized protein LOC119975050 [Scyliorhinus canicula]|uniref:uncharacterized protein LOC119975050 n=1 Tax=Scyliorhinus canicula TaxID=7830 RepID=UPI0018F381EF|nr:uncharacterized protein LOC119975050 [Scyliorhinus canicula]